MTFSQQPSSLSLIIKKKKRRTITATAKNYSPISFEIFIINKYFKNLSFRVQFKY